MMPDVLGALEPDPVLGEQILVLVDLVRHVVEEVADHLRDLGGHVEGHTPHARERRHHAGAGQRLEDVVGDLALAEGQEEHRHGADIERPGAHADQVRGHARHLHADCADVLRPRRSLYAAELLHGEHVSGVVGELREIVEAVGVGSELVEGLLLRQLLHPPVQVPHVGHAVDDFFPVQLQEQAEHAMRRRVLGPHVEGKGLGAQAPLTGAARRDGFDVGGTHESLPRTG